MLETKLIRPVANLGEVDQNFDIINDRFNKNILLNFSGALFDIRTGRIIENQPISNPFPFIPTDVIITASDETNFMMFHVKRFTEKHLFISSTGPCNVRAIIGKFTNRAIELNL